MSIYQLSSLISKNNKKYQSQYDKVVAANHNELILSSLISVFQEQAMPRLTGRK